VSLRQFINQDILFSTFSIVFSYFHKVNWFIKEHLRKSMTILEIKGFRALLISILAIMYWVRMFLRSVT
jgi:hypothetical protein